MKFAETFKKCSNSHQRSRSFLECNLQLKMERNRKIFISFTLECLIEEGLEKTGRGGEGYSKLNKRGVGHLLNIL